VVFMVAMEEGIFPHSSSKEAPEQLEEERRLAYVGMTRARECLFLSAASRRMMFGSWGSNPVSRFVTEVPTHLFHGRTASAGMSAAGRAASAAGSVIPGAVTSRPKSGAFTFNPQVKWSEPKKSAAAPIQGDTVSGTMLNLKPGVRVVHQIFGPGRVEETTGASLAEFRVTVRFEQKGLKTLLLQYAALQVINSENA